MIKIQIVSVGKTKESWLEAALAEYFKRLQALVAFTFIFCKDDKALEAQVLRMENSIGLDPAGELLDSYAFAQFLNKKIIAGGSQLQFIIGGPEGLTPMLKQQLPLISLSPLTFTHQMTRLILVEQIYRSMEILRGSKYHKA